MSIPHVTLPSSWVTGSLIARVGPPVTHGSHGYFSTGSLADQSRPNALYHLESLKLEHLKHDEIVDLYVKCVELLAGSKDE